MILVPMDARGITLKRTLTALGYDEAPYGHAELLFEAVRVAGPPLCDANRFVSHFNTLLRQAWRQEF
jgi:hypothetical protein